MSTLHQDKYTFLIVFRTVLPKMINVQDTNYRENKKLRLELINFLRRWYRL